MIRSLTAASAFLAVPAIAAAPVQQFNLICSGSQHTKSIFIDTTKPYALTYRIDLARKIWCEDECRNISDIEDIQPTSIRLQYENVNTLSERSLVSNTIDRETGEHKITITHSNPPDRSSIIILETKGQCQRAPFSGFPKFETKF